MSISTEDQLERAEDERADWGIFEKLLHDYFDTESLGIVDKGIECDRNSCAISLLENTSCRNGNVWEISLLWAADELNIPDSRPNALRRFHLLERKFNRDPAYAKLYITEIDRLIEKGYAEKVDSPPKGKVWYLPHFGVQNVNKPGKVRVVFDSAAKSDSVSFNDLLLVGPDLLKSLLGVLMRFRQKPFAVKGDIRDMFLKIKIRKEDRDAQRFLWRGEGTSSIQEYVISSVLFGAKSSPATAIFIKNKNAMNFKEVFPDTARSIEKNSYMDDFLESCDTEEEARSRVKQVIEISCTASWEMHGWASNGRHVLENIDGVVEENSAVGVVSSDERVLGLHWDPKLDLLSFNFNKFRTLGVSVDSSKVPTRREVLSLIMSVFDPLGLISPVTIHSRILMQDICARKIKWDEFLGAQDFKEWLWWLQELEKVKEVHVPRCYYLGNLKIISSQLHIFCDASSKAFAAVAYWRFSLSDGSFHSTIIMSKCKFAPLKTLTIPRLELQAAVLATRISEVVSREHDFKADKIFFWSDSQIVLQWIKSDQRNYKTFVVNRLSEIKEKSRSAVWRWVPTKHNPADDATRFAPDEINANSRWFLGPSFLRNYEKVWPKLDSIAKSSVNVVDQEIKVKAIVLTFVAKEVPAYLPDFKRFSSWLRLLRVAACVLEATDRWLEILESRTHLQRQEHAELLWVLEIQQVSFGKEISI
uniref:RNase H type-1 domain-containing protein n=2 Tax=Trichogramma kaykai TaxID=54128 RepID=A0ABD2WWD8_9HYME